MQPLSRGRVANSLLAALPRKDCRHLPSALEPGTLTCGEVRYEGTCIPRCTAGRAEIASNQRLTLGKSLRSVLCHSWRATHG
jgi:hypothetical protein